MELIRKILVAVEVSNQTLGLIPLQYENYNEDQILYQVKILAEHSIIIAIDCSSTNNFALRANGLTWDGHVYIEVIRDEARWPNIKE